MMSVIYIHSSHCLFDRNMFLDHISEPIIWTVVEANVIMIAACAPTLHPVYEQVRKRLSSTYLHRASSSNSPRANGGDGGPRVHGASTPYQNHDNHTAGASVKPPGFWTAVLALSSLTGSTLTTQRTDQTRSTHVRPTGGSITAPEERQDEEPSATAVPMRTLEDAVDWDVQRGDLEAGWQTGLDKAQLKLYHASHSGE